MPRQSFEITYYSPLYIEAMKGRNVILFPEPLTRSAHPRQNPARLNVKGATFRGTPPPAKSSQLQAAQMSFAPKPEFALPTLADRHCQAVNGSNFPLRQRFFAPAGLGRSIGRSEIPCEIYNEEAHTTHQILFTSYLGSLPHRRRRR